MRTPIRGPGSACLRTEPGQVAEEKWIKNPSALDVLLLSHELAGCVEVASVSAEADHTTAGAHHLSGEAVLPIQIFFSTRPV